jgi:acetylornithine deacetylase/succinyl-diaminopimelate desuccinylase-like protein
VKCGPGTSRRSHTADECVDLPEVVEARALYTRVAMEYLA